MNTHRFNIFGTAGKNNTRTRAEEARGRAGRLALALLAGLSLSAPAPAATKNWTATTNGNWEDGANWGGGTAPAPGDDIRMDTSGTATVTDATGPLTTATVYIGSTAGGDASLVFNGSQLWTNSGLFSVGFNAATGGKGRLDFYGSGTLKTANLTMANDGGISVADIHGNAFLQATGFVRIGQSGEGTLRLFESGSISANELIVGYNATGVGALFVSGNAHIQTTADVQIGRTGTGSLHVSENGSISAGRFLVTQNSNGLGGSVFLTGAGQITSTGDAFIGTSNKGDMTVSGNGYFRGNTVLHLGYANSGAGTLDVRESGSVSVQNAILLGSGSGRGGRINVHDNALVSTSGTFSVGHAGNGRLWLSGGTVEAAEFVLGNAASGTGTLEIAGAGEGRIVDGGGNALAITAGSGLATVLFSHTATSSTFANNLSGAITVTHSATGVTILTGSSTHTGPTNLNAGVLQVGAAHNLGANSALNGTGTLALDNASAFEFSTGQLAGAFTGVVRLQNSTTLALDALAANNQAMLERTGVILQLGAGGVGEVGATSTLHTTLDLAGGSLVVGADALDNPHILTVDTLKSTAPGGKIIVDSAILDSLGSGGGGGGSIFDTPGDGTQIQILAFVNMGDGVTNGRTFSLADVSGQVITSSSSSLQNAGDTDIAGYVHSGNTAKVDTAGADGAGVYLTYSITKIESTHATKALVINPSGAPSNTISALLTGDGAGFRFEGGETILNNDSNDYTGAATIASGGTVSLGVDNALNPASALIVENGGVLNLNDKTQTLAASGTVLGANGLRGSGVLGITGGALHVLAANDNLAASINITGNGLARLDNLAGLGSGTVAVDATSRLALNADGSFANALAGSGTVQISAGKTVRPTGDNSTFAGSFSLGDGATLGIGAASQLGAAAINSGAAGGGTLQLEGYQDVFSSALSGSLTLRITGSGGTASHAIITGVGSDFTGGVIIDSGNTLDLRDASALNARPVINSGDLVLNFTGAFNNALGASTGRVIVDGGAVTFDTAQTYGGETLVRNGTLRAGVASAIGPNSALAIGQAGVFDMNGHAQILRALDNRGGLVRFGPASGSVACINLDVAELSGSGTYAMRVNLATGESDRLRVTQASSGDHVFVFSRIGDAPANPGAIPANIIVEDPFGGANYEGAFTENMVTYKLQQTGAGQYGLVYAPSDAAQSMLATAGVIGTEWHYSLDSLHKRMGDVRALLLENTAKKRLRTEIWAVASAYHLNAGAGLAGTPFDQDTYGVTAGFDRMRSGENHSFLFGGFLSTTRTDRRYDNNGTGETDDFGFGFYATWLHRTGWHVDFVAKIDHYSNDIDARNSDGSAVRASYEGDTAGISLELGRRITIGKFWVEPQLQGAIAWLGGERYTTDTNLSVKLDSATARQYRGQIRFGVDMGARWRPYAKVAKVRSDTSGGLLHAEFGTRDPQFGGWRFEAGAGMGLLLGKRSRLYLDYEYNKADHYERPWAVSLGFCHLW